MTVFFFFFANGGEKKITCGFFRRNFQETEFYSTCFFLFSIAMGILLMVPPSVWIPVRMIQHRATSHLTHDEMYINEEEDF